MELRVIQDSIFIYTIRGLPVWVVAGIEHHLPPPTLILGSPGIEHHAVCRTPKVTLGSLEVLATMPSGQDVFRLLGPPLVQILPIGLRFDP